jgi:hypothetical protein
MVIRNFDPQEIRRLREGAFEPLGEGYVYFKHRWAPGLPVTAEEREAYLAAPGLSFGAPFSRGLEEP